ncbi:MAG: hypothetical protein WCH39_02585 [Schlesneria sp.]
MKAIRHGYRWGRNLVGFMAIVILFARGSVVAQDSIGRFYDRAFSDDSGEHKYVIFVPVSYRSDKPSQALLFLHGAGERGKDNRLQLLKGIAPYIKARAKTFPFLVVFPQCEMAEGRILESWSADEVNGKRALNSLDDARKHYNFDEKGVVLTGWSMGGYGVWSLAMAEPSRWSALVPVSGGGDADKVAILKEIPVWAFHGAKDALVKPDQDRKMVDALKAAGGTATFTELPNGFHDISDEVYGNDAVVAWMLNPGKSVAQLGTATVKPVDPVKVPFVPVREISRAVGMRIGNDVLDAMSYTIPQTVSPDLLTGRLNDMFDSTVASGRQFSIRFSGISYNGQLERVVARGWSQGRILVQLGIRNVTLTIGGTSVEGARHSAQAGPITIAIGQRYPVWFNLELEPYIADRKLRLRVASSGFRIPNDNWSISNPAGVSVRGFGMTEEAVVSGLRNGLYGAKSRIENEVTSIAPRVATEIEKSLTLPESGSSATESGSTLAKFWPLPINPPRFKAWPEQISADENGISLIAGLTIASINPFDAPKPLQQGSGAPSATTSVVYQRPDESRLSLGQLPADKAMHFVIAPKILGSLTELYTNSAQTQLDLQDLPEPLFSQLAERATLQEIIPDLKQYGESLQVRSTLRFLRPLDVKDADNAVTKGAKSFEFQLPDAQVTVSIKTGHDQKQWQPCATFDLKVSEQVKAELLKPAHDQRVISLDWLSAADVTGTGKFIETYKGKDTTLQADRYVELFKAGWAAYCGQLKTATADVPDIKVGEAKMRMFDFNWRSPVVDISYHVARIKLSNLSDQPFTYETKAPTSSWGAPLTLKPGASHEFEIPYPLTYRHSLPGGSETYTLPVGSHSEFRVPVTGGVPRLFAAQKISATEPLSNQHHESKGVGNSLD